MKIDRLIGILTILLQKDHTTAPELAEKFEVSRRTINRDIEDLCKAGIPIHTIQGAGGGIKIMDGYEIDKTLLTLKDMQMIMAGLRSLDSVSGTKYYSLLMEKINPGASDFIGGRDSILIDLSSWNKDLISTKIAIIHSAIEERKYIFFQYYAPKGESLRKIKPYYLIFKWSSWYVWGWCIDREDFRLFKLNRMNEIVIDETEFKQRKVEMPDLSIRKMFPGRIKVRALFNPEVKWKVVEEFGPDCYETTEDGKMLFHGEYTDMENLISWMLTFGDNVKVIEPECVKDELLRIAENIKDIYKKDESQLQN